MTEVLVQWPALTTVLVSAHTFCTFAMAGIIWFVQVIHYPGLDRPSFEGADYARNASATGFVIAPLMVTEAAAGLVLALAIPGTLTFALLLLTAANWLWTFSVSVPLHRKLIAAGHDPAAAKSLVRTNWVRTVLWSLRAAILLGAGGALATSPSA